MRPRIGLILPSVQVVTEPLFNKMAGRHVDFAASRIMLRGAGIDDLRDMDGGLARAVEELASAHVDLIISCCTASGALAGSEADRAFCREVERSTGIKMTSTMLSIVELLQALKIKTLTVVTPYLPELNTVERQYLSANGFEVLSDAGQSIADGFEISTVTPVEIEMFAFMNWNATSDGLLLSCMNWRAAEAVSSLTRRLHAPVITSHTATLWNAARILDSADMAPIF